MPNIVKFILIYLGSFPNSHRQIEPELLRIILQNWRLDNILSCQLNNDKLSKGLELLKPRTTTGTLAAYDELDYNELFRFRQIFCLEIDNTVNGSEAFPGEMLTPRKNRVSLPDDIYQILIDYYCNAYESKFVTIAESLSASPNDFIVTNMVDQIGCVRISAETFGSMMAPRFSKNAHVLAKFILDNETSDLFPGQVQYYIEHTTKTPNGLKTHRLALIRWYNQAPNRQTRFYTSFDTEECSNIELWENDFYDLGRDCLIPIHNIYSRFVSSEFIINKTTYKAIIPINRRFHL